MNQQAHTVYYNTRHKILAQIEKLQKDIVDHPDNLEIDWTSVGDMNYILQQLKQLNGEE